MTDGGTNQWERKDLVNNAACADFIEALKSISDTCTTLYLAELPTPLMILFSKIAPTRILLHFRGPSESLFADLAPDELWRSLPRLKRTVILIVLLALTCVFTFIIASPFIKIADDASMDMLDTVRN
ncbi:hypothetical protein OSTOST_20892, partial [Ostertagia ostertagi]